MYWGSAPGTVLFKPLGFLSKRPFGDVGFLLAVRM